MKKILLSTFIAAFAIPVFSYAASFDCAKAASATEKLICSDEKVSALDEQLAKSYKVALDKSSDKDVIKKTQVEWLKQQRVCKDLDCLAKVYQERIAGLNGEENSLVQSGNSSSLNVTDSTNSTNKKPLTFKLVYGDSYPICKPYVDMLNKTKYTEYPACERKILPEFSQFQAVKWTEIVDKNEMVKVLKELMDIEFAKMGKLNSDFHKSSLESAKDRIKSGETRLYASSFDIGGDGDIEGLYKETWFYAKAKVPRDCAARTKIYIKDKKITLENAPSFYGSSYYGLGLNGNNELLAIDKYIYSSHSSGLRDPYDIAIYGSNETDGNTKSGMPICGINVQ